MVGTVRWKAKAPSLLRKSVAIVCESSTHFLLPFSSLAIPVSTQPPTEQAASDTEEVLWRMQRQRPEQGHQQTASDSEGVPG